MFSSNASQVSSDANYIESCFSTYLYTGTGSAQTITNNIDLSTKGGLIWSKSRSAVQDHSLIDTVRGNGSILYSNLTAAADTGVTTGVTAFNTTGYSLGSGGFINQNNATYASWTFRKQPKFFDVVTYTGNSTARTISHNLGSVPGCIIIKGTTGPASTQNWAVYHRGTGNTKALFLDLTQAPDVATNYWNDTTPTSTVFSLGAGASVNNNTTTYVAYLFAHDAGGFGLTGTDNVITCGSFTSNGSGDATVSLGYEPQWVMFKCSTNTENWNIFDNMRGWPAPGTTSGRQQLKPNLSDAESSNNYTSLTATGFTGQNLYASSTYIYIAIRKGPMAVPTVGTSVFSPIISSASAGTVLTTNFPVDLQITGFRSTTGAHRVMDRLRGVSTNATAVGSGLATTSTGAESSSTGTYTLGWDNTSFKMTTTFESTSDIFWNFKRAPSFFDEVCFTGTGSTLVLNHNLTVAPELIIGKRRTGGSYWILSGNFGASTYWYKNDWGANDSSTSASYSGNLSFGAQPTSTTVTLDTNSALNVSAYDAVLWMWATCAGVSKIGTYTGNGGTQAIACGFASGARFVLITRVGVVGNNDTYVYDTARGMTTLTDPYLLLDTTAAETATLGSVTTTTGGFTVNASILSAINTNSASYLFLAIA